MKDFKMIGQYVKMKSGEILFILDKIKARYNTGEILDEYLAINYQNSTRCVVPYQVDCIVNKDGTPINLFEDGDTEKKLECEHEYGKHLGGTLHECFKCGASELYSEILDNSRTGKTYPH